MNGDSSMAANDGLVGVGWDKLAVYLYGLAQKTNVPSLSITNSQSTSERRPTMECGNFGIQQQWWAGGRGRLLG